MLAFLNRYRPQGTATLPAVNGLAFETAVEVQFHDISLEKDGNDQILSNAKLDDVLLRLGQLESWFHHVCPLHIIKLGQAGALCGLGRHSTVFRGLGGNKREVMLRHLKPGSSIRMPKAPILCPWVIVSCTFWFATWSASR